MRTPLSAPWAVAVQAVALFLLPAICLADAMLSQRCSPAQVNVGEKVVVTLTIQGGTLATKDPGMFGMGNLDLTLPAVDGLHSGNPFSSVTSVNGAITTTAVFILIASRPGDFTIPAFDIHTREGDVLHATEMRIEVIGGDASATNAAPSNPVGPVVMPPTNAASAQMPNGANTTDPSGANLVIPRDPDGGPAKVFILIAPQTMDAYVGQSIPMRIDFFIRMDVLAEQNSLPTIKGSDFLMNSFTTRGHESTCPVEGREYGCETWLTAISAPKAGDFPLKMVRDTYWIKSFSNGFINPFSGLPTRHADLAHEPVFSNELTMHVHPLPTEGQPAHFTGAIGQFQITGNAQPTAVAVGEPVTLAFSISGEGNFDYVRCPTLPDDPAWKAYIPSSKTAYRNESRTSAVKTFEQSVIPQKNGNVPLPTADFSYFNPDTKQYVTVPIPLAEITVTGSLAPIASALPSGSDDAASIPATPAANEFLPNQLTIGSLQNNLTPTYRERWFWVVQIGLVALPLIGLVFLFLHARSAPDNGQAERALRLRSRQQEEEAMTEAVRQNDPRAFFLAARHAVQLQLGEQWKLSPEAITLGEVRRRDPELAETVAPLFVQADEVIYSGMASPGLDLAQWDQRVRTEFLSSQPASS